MVHSSSKPGSKVSRSHSDDRFGIVSISSRHCRKVQSLISLLEPARWHFEMPGPIHKENREGPSVPALAPQFLLCESRTQNGHIRLPDNSQSVAMLHGSVRSAEVRPFARMSSELGIPTCSRIVTIEKGRVRTLGPQNHARMIPQLKRLSVEPTSVIREVVGGSIGFRLLTRGVKANQTPAL